MTSRSCIGLGVIIGAEAKQYLVLHIDDPKGLVAKEKGSGMAWATSTLVPQFVENKIYEQVKQELEKQFKEKGSPVTVTLTQSPPNGKRPSTDMLGGAILGALVTALGFVVVGLVRKK